jgi:hypothetical protein
VKKLFTVTISLLAMVLALPAFAGAQDSDLPWFMVQVRPEIGGGSGGVTLTWDTIGSLADHEEEAEIQGASYFGLSPEVIFMPTAGRQFMLSASSHFGAGSAKFEEKAGDIVDGQDLTYTFWSLAMGVGYQWYFGALQKTNLYLLPHIGFARTRLTVDYLDEERQSDPLGGVYFDFTIGSTYRFDSGFLLGGQLALAHHRFNGTTEAGDFWDVETNGGMNMARLGLVLGFALK